MSKPVYIPISVLAGGENLERQGIFIDVALRETLGLPLLRDYRPTTPAVGTVVLALPAEPLINRKLTHEALAFYAQCALGSFLKDESGWDWSDGLGLDDDYQSELIGQVVAGGLAYLGCDEGCCPLSEDDAASVLDGSISDLDANDFVLRPASRDIGLYIVAAVTPNYEDDNKNNDLDLRPWRMLPDSL